jgi:hypothetical protein
VIGATPSLPFSLNVATRKNRQLNISNILGILQMAFALFR